MSRMIIASTRSRGKPSSAMCSFVNRRSEGRCSPKRSIFLNFFCCCLAANDDWYLYCKRPILSTPTAWIGLRAEGAMRTCFQAGGRTSARIRSRWVSSVMHCPLASSYRKPRSFEPRLRHQRAREPRSTNPSKHFSPFSSFISPLLDIYCLNYEAHRILLSTSDHGNLIFFCNDYASEKRGR